MPAFAVLPNDAIPTTMKERYKTQSADKPPAACDAQKLPPKFKIPARCGYLFPSSPLENRQALLRAGCPCNRTPLQKWNGPSTLLNGSTNAARAKNKKTDQPNIGTGENQRQNQSESRHSESCSNIISGGFLAQTYKQRQVFGERIKGKKWLTGGVAL
jgi:hypothetical protein